MRHFKSKIERGSQSSQKPFTSRRCIDRSISTGHVRKLGIASENTAERKSKIDHRETYGLQTRWEIRGHGRS